MPCESATLSLREEETKRMIAYRSDWGAEDQIIFSNPNSPKGSGVSLGLPENIWCPVLSLFPSPPFK